MAAQDIAGTVARALELSPIIDGHNDWPWELRLRHDSSVAGLESGFPGHTDIARLRAGHVGAQLWSVFVEDLPPGTEGRNARAVAETLEQIDVVHRLVEGVPGRPRARALGRGRGNRPRLRTHRLPARRRGRPPDRRLRPRCCGCSRRSASAT